jgi:hypothetical protein
MYSQPATEIPKIFLVKEKDEKECSKPVPERQFLKHVFSFWFICMLLEVRLDPPHNSNFLCTLLRICNFLITN